MGGEHPWESVLLTIPFPLTWIIRNSRWSYRGGATRTFWQFTDLMLLRFARAARCQAREDSEQNEVKNGVDGNGDA
jgi:hypothetical protein